MELKKIEKEKPLKVQYDLMVFEEEKEEYLLTEWEIMQHALNLLDLGEKEPYEE